MSLKKLTLWLAGGILCLSLAPVARGQHYQPFIDYGYFDYDMQPFAPAADIDGYGGEPQMRTGWYGAYNRMYISVSRPNGDTAFGQTPQGPVLNGVNYNQSDFTWGNRWDLGYMTDDNHGWGFTYMHIDGPNVNEIVRVERINRVNEDDEGRPPPDEDDPMFVYPPQDRNQSGPTNSARFYDVTDSVNDGNFNSLELNKIWRLAPLQHGGLLEPFVGVRYAQFTDTFNRGDYIRYDEEGTVVPMLPQTPTDMPPFDDATIEDYIQDWYMFQNEMIGGQLGVRWLKEASRWNLSSELRGFAFQNFQTLTRTFNQQRTYYDGFGTGAEAQAMEFSKDITYHHATATVVGCDIRAEAAYEVTRDFHLTVGCQFIGMFTGIGRGPNIHENSEDLIMTGVSFGAVWNR